MDFITALRCQVELRRLKVAAAYGVLRKEERIAAKEKRPIPRLQLAQIHEAINYAKADAEGACISLEAALKYPPLPRAVV